MYYPIIDKLKEVMSDLTSVKEKEPLIVDGTLTSQTTGAWSGNFSDINLSLTNNKPVYLKISAMGNTFLIPVIQISSDAAFSCVFKFGNSQGIAALNIDNTVDLILIE